MKEVRQFCFWPLNKVRTQEELSPVGQEMALEERRRKPGHPSLADTLP